MDGSGSGPIVASAANFTPAASRLHSAYTVGGIIGRGGFSIVRAAKDKRTGKDMAVKIIPKVQHAGKPKELRRLRDEIRVLASLRHPNIMPLLEVYETVRPLPLFAGGGSVAGRRGPGSFERRRVPCSVHGPRTFLRAPLRHKGPSLR